MRNSTSTLEEVVVVNNESANMRSQFEHTLKGMDELMIGCPKLKVLKAIKCGINAHRFRYSTHCDTYNYYFPIKSSLLVLDMSENDIGAPGIAYLTDAVAKSRLAKINIRGCGGGIGVPEFKKLAMAVAKIRPPRNVKVESDNDIVMRMVETLRAAKTLFDMERYRPNQQLIHRRDAETIHAYLGDEDLFTYAEIGKFLGVPIDAESEENGKCVVS